MFVLSIDKLILRAIARLIIFTLILLSVNALKVLILLFIFNTRVLLIKRLFIFDSSLIRYVIARIFVVYTRALIANFILIDSKKIDSLFDLKERVE